MKIYVNLQNPGDLTVEHAGRKLDWRAIKSVEQKEFDIFKEINEYWAHCGVDKQESIFNCFKNVHAVFSEFLHAGVGFDDSELLRRLRPLIAALFEHHKQEDVYSWYRHYSGIGIPSNIPSVYDESEGRPGTRDQTYDRADYERLIVLSVSIRCMIPIWGEFIIRTENILGNQLKEYWALSLLRDSDVMNCSAMARLRRYIEAMVARAPIELGIPLKVTSSENFNDLLLGLTAVRRLTRGDLRTGQTSANLAAFIYGFLRMKLEGASNSIGEVKVKTPVSSTGDGENNLSDLEGFKIKQAVPTGDTLIAPEYLRINMDNVLDGNPVNQSTFTEHVQIPLIKLLNPRDDITSLVKQAYVQTRYLKSEVIEDNQLLLCGFLMSDYISVRAIPYMNKSDVQRLIAFCAATMWSYGQKDLACLMINIQRVPILSGNIARAADVRSRISKDLNELLKKQFPFIRPGRGGKPQDSGAVFNAIDQIVDMMKEHDIHYNLPTSWAKELGVTNGAMYQVPTNIRNILGEFILRLNTRTPNQPLY